MNPDRSQRGRPLRHDIEDLRRMALVPLLRDGYEHVTMAQIASEVGGSVRTLHRYFPNKADIVWGTLDRSFLALRRGLADASPELSPIAAIAQAVTALFSPASGDVDTARDSLRLVATTPELQASQSVAFRLWRQELVAFIATRLGTSPEDLVAVSTGAAAQTAVMSALEWWATSEAGGSPEEHVQTALRGLAELGTSSALR